ncbi:MAG: SMC-Scp complex subunit ScpB [Planctomycetota bacterium]|nr:SMC-Scp complex subunit ScpB [Planctomycetota bacterium]
MDQSVKQQVEALLFASSEPISLSRLKDVAGCEPAAVRIALDELRSEYDSQQRAFALQELAGGFQLITRPEYSELILKLEQRHAQGKLSPAAMETLSIVAYKQPIGRAEIESIRGVQSGQILRALMEKGLVRPVGRQETLGRPLLYGTTNRFMQSLGFASLSELPRIEELNVPDAAKGDA